MARQVNAQAMVAAYQAGLAAGAGKYKQGVMGVTQNPAAAAAARVADGTWARNTVAAADKLQASLSAVTLQGWQQAAAGVGANNFAASAAKAGPKYAAQSQKLAAAATAASAAAAGAVGPQAKWLASVNAMREAFGKPPI